MNDKYLKYLMTKGARRPAGFKLYRKVLRHKYGSSWKDYIAIG